MFRGRSKSCACKSGSNSVSSLRNKPHGNYWIARWKQTVAEHSWLHKFTMPMLPSPAILLLFFSHHNSNAKRIMTHKIFSFFGVFSPRAPQTKSSRSKWKIIHMHRTKSHLYIIIIIATEKGALPKIKIQSFDTHKQSSVENGFYYHLPQHISTPYRHISPSATHISHHFHQ